MPFFSALVKWKKIFSQTDTVRTKKKTASNLTVQSVINDHKTGQKKQAKHPSSGRVISGRITKGQKNGSNSTSGKEQARDAAASIPCEDSKHMLDGDTLVKARSSSERQEKGSSTAGDLTDGLDSDAKSHLLAQYLDGWSADELWLRERIDKRGEEPLMPDLWQWDFPSFPDSLFAPQKHQVLVKNMHTSVTEAVDQFAFLVDNGARCRDLMDQEKFCEHSLAKGIERYRNWTLRDGKLQDSQCLQVTVTCAAKRNESVGSVMGRATEKLAILGSQWRQLFQSRRSEYGTNSKIPTLCAFVISYSVVQIVCYDPNNPGARTRTLGILNHQVVGHDVWHAFAIAIICIHARNQLMELESKGMFERVHASIEDTDI